jgi:hypothetical protein
VIRQSIWARVTTRDDVIDFLAQRDDHMASVVEKRCWTAGGVALGVIVTATYSTTQNWPTVVPAWASTGGITATLIIGAIAGLYPAIWAARLAPTEALATTLPAICTLQRQAGGRLDEEIERLRALRQPSPRRLKAQHPTGTGEPIGSRIGQAIKAHAAAIVTEAIAYEVAANGYKSAIAAPVPVVATANGTPAGFPDSAMPTTIDRRDAAIQADRRLVRRRCKRQRAYPLPGQQLCEHREVRPGCKGRVRGRVPVLLGNLHRLELARSRHPSKVGRIRTIARLRDAGRGRRSREGR